MPDSVKGFGDITEYHARKLIIIKCFANMLIYIYKLLSSRMIWKKDGLVFI